MKRWILFSMFAFATSVSAQVGVSLPSKNTESKWVFGGGAGVNAGSGGGFGVQVSPSLGYKLSPNLIGGADAEFYWYGNENFRSTMTGVGPYLTYYVENFYLGANFMEYFINQKNKITGDKANFDEAALYLGGGYMQRIGNAAALQIGAMYNVLWKKDKSVFGSPIVPGIGVVFGI